MLTHRTLWWENRDEEVAVVRNSDVLGGWVELQIKAEGREMSIRLSAYQAKQVAHLLEGE